MKFQFKLKFHGLLIFGTAIAIYGAYNIVCVDYLIQQDLDLTNAISTKPTIITREMTLTPKSQSEYIDFIPFKFETTDIFSVGNPINYTIIMAVKNIDNIDRIFVIRATHTDDGDMTFKKAKYLEEIGNRSGNILYLENSHLNGFSASDQYTPNAELSDDFLFVLFTKNDRFEFMQTNDLLPIHSELERMNLNATRTSLLQIISQTKSNHIIEGLTWIFLSQMPFQLAIHFRKKKDSDFSLDIHTKPSIDHKKWSMPFYD
ncbi:MAG: hypothetical protein HZA84_09190 [Thaumarchaeota archaeon]|nr:hypothetical protein [Nitrososphaerota archaeon]